MTMKLNSLSRWRELAAGSAIYFDRAAGDEERRIRVNLNLERYTAFFVATKAENRFLASLPPGLQTLEFSAAGAVQITAEEGAGEVQFQTSELEPTHCVIADPAVFTRIANRKHRNPELEEMMWRVEQNMLRRLDQQAGEMEAAFARRQREAEGVKPSEEVRSAAPGATAEGKSGNAVSPNEPVPTGQGETTGAENGSEPPGGPA